MRRVPARAPLARGLRLSAMRLPKAWPLRTRALDECSGCGHQVSLTAGTAGADDGPHRGRSLAGKKMLVAGAVECRGDAIGRIRLRAIPAATSAALCGFIAGHVVRGSSVRTDGFRQYHRISQQGFAHIRIVVGDPKNASKLFPRVHRVFSLLDRWLLGTLHGSIRLPLRPNLRPAHLPCTTITGGSLSEPDT